MAYTIDEFFRGGSSNVGLRMVGKLLIPQNTSGEIYIVESVKMYYTSGRQMKNLEVYPYGRIMMLPMKNGLNFCVSTAEPGAEEHDFILINQIVGSGIYINSSPEICQALGLEKKDDGRHFSELFQLDGKTMPSIYNNTNVKRTYVGEYRKCR
jgi:hypothetical protein